MRLLFFSDLHLSDGSRIDNFGFKKRDLFLKFIKAIKKSRIEKIFVIGDIYELWQGEGSEKERLERAKKTYPRIASFLSNFCFELVGNHDRARSKIDNIPSNKLIELDGTRIWIEHGDRFDQYANGFFPYLVVGLFALVERLLGTRRALRIQRLMERYVITPASPSYPGNFSEYEEGARSLAKEKKCDVVIFGHTHRKKMRKWQDATGRQTIYLNSGAWVNEHADYVLIDTQKQSFKVKTFYGQEEL